MTKRVGWLALMLAIGAHANAQVLHKLVTITTPVRIRAVSFMWHKRLGCRTCAQRIDLYLAIAVGRSVNQSPAGRWRESAGVFARRKVAGDR